LRDQRQPGRDEWQLPTGEGWSENLRRRGAEQGALFSHYTNWIDLRRRTAEYVDKILEAAKPGDLPVEEPSSSSSST